MCGGEEEKAVGCPVGVERSCCQQVIPHPYRDLLPVGYEQLVTGADAMFVCLTK